jgi:hypothetical protein
MVNKWLTAQFIPAGAAPQKANHLREGDSQKPAKVNPEKGAMVFEGGRCTL